MLDGAAVFAEGWQSGWKPDPVRTVSEWADEKRRLTREGSSEPGQWRTSRVPYLREIMDVLSPHHPSREAVFMSSTQVGKTEIGLNWIGSTIEDDPGPMLVVLPTVNVAKRWSRQRLAGMIRESGSLRSLVSPARKRDSGNTTMLKEFPGGMVIIGGANSAADLSSMPIRKLFCDETDRYPYELDNEGDPITLAVRRTANFPRRKIFYSSSPTIESLSRINQLYQASDQRHYFVPCPDCGERQVLQWENLQWEEGKPETARYRCSACASLIAEHNKTAMLEAGEWRPTHPGRDVPGFHINGLYSPIGLGDSWEEHAAHWERVHRDPSKRKAFTNTVLGECTKDPSEKIDWKVLKDRADLYKLRTLPAGVLVLTAGVDVQGNRLEVQLLGWGRMERAWVLDYLVIPGDPTQRGVWDKLDEYVGRPLTNAWGLPMRICACAVDAGYLQDEVLKFTRPRAQRNVFAVVGIPGVNKSILVRSTKPDKDRKGRTVKRSVDLWNVSPSAAKEWIFLRLVEDGKLQPDERLVRFSQDLPEEYYTQLTAEVYDPKTRQWVKQQTRNEALDTMVYARAAAMHPNVRIHVYREADWLALENVLQPKTQDLFNAAPAYAPTVSPDATPPRASSRRRVRSRGI